MKIDIEKILEYEVLVGNHGMTLLKIVSRANQKGVRFAIKHYTGNVLTRDGDWEYEPRPSSRSNNFIEKTRFSWDECWELIEKFNLMEI